MIGEVASRDGVPVRYDVNGRGDRALVFVHGWSCDRTYWREQVGFFAPRFTVVSVDLAGHGESGVGRRSWTIRSMGEDVMAVVEALALREIVLVGHSMGGDVVVEVARSLPERVAGLVWVDTYRSLTDEPDREAVEAEAHEFMTPFEADFVETTRRFVRELFPADADPDLIEWVAADMSAAPPEVALDAMWHSFTNEAAAIAGLREAAVPAVAINPGYRTTDVASLARHGVRAVLVPGVGHFLMLEDAPAFNRCLEDAIAAWPP